MARLAWEPAARLTLGAEMGGGIRRYDGGVQSDATLRGGLDLRFSTDWVAVTIGADIERRESTEPLARRRELAPWLGVDVAHDRLTIEARYFAFVRDFDDPGQHTLTALADSGAWTRVGFNILR